MNSARAKVLIIDYEEDVLIDLEHLLQDEGFDTETVWTAEDAFRLVNRGQFDLVLVNEYMPDMDVGQLISNLRRTAGDIPCIVMLSGATMTTGSCRFSSAGVIDVVCKTSHTKVIEVVRACHVERRHLRASA